MSFRAMDKGEKKYEEDENEIWHQTQMMCTFSWWYDSTRRRKRRKIENTLTYCALNAHGQKRRRRLWMTEMGEGRRKGGGAE